MPEQKTNVMRILEQKKIPYTPHEYPHGGEAVDGVTVAALTGLPTERVYKTLVTQGGSRKNYVFVIPAAAELDLKKAAKAAGEKSVAMIRVSEINALTGYVRGGCSPIGMKKQFETFYHVDCLRLGSMAVSAGRIGAQVELAPEALIGLTRGKTAELTVT